MLHPDGRVRYACSSGAASVAIGAERRGEHGSQASHERAAVHSGLPAVDAARFRATRHCAELSRICRTVSSSSRTLMGLP